MKKLALLSVLLPGLALGGTADLSWTWPTANTDGSAVQTTGPSALVSMRVDYFQCATATTAWPATPTTTSVAYPLNTYKVLNLTDGKLWCFRIAAVNSSGNASATSNVGTKFLTAPTPNPPVLTVQQPVAFRMRQAVDGYTMEPIGSIAIGTQCKDQTVGAYNIVPRTAVTMTSRFDTMPLIVYAQCG